MEKDIQKSIEIYKEQLNKGDIQMAYFTLMKYIAELKALFPKEYHTGNISFGYLDYTYFPFFNQYLRNHKLRFGIVLNHNKMQFELWLMGQNADIQNKYWDILKNQIDFHNKKHMTEHIINRALSLSQDIQDYLERVHNENM